MEQYVVTGMSCAACQTRVEKAVSNVPGVESCAVSLLTNSMGVEGSASQEAIIKAVQDAGYGASIKGDHTVKKNVLSSEEDALIDHETPVLKRRLYLSLIFLVLLMYITMGHHMLHLPIPKFFHENPMGLGLLQLCLALIVMIINKKFFVSGFKALLAKSPNMDTLVALGSSVSFGWSLYILFKMTGMNNIQEMMNVYHNELYFESAAMIPALITVGKMLEAKSKGKTTDALKSLLKLAPKTATIIRDDQEINVPIEEVVIGDLFVVKPGESIPVDGVVEEGHSAINEAALTGESIPVDKEVGDLVSAATMNQSGYLKCRATRVGEDTTLSQIIQMVSDAAATKAPIAKKADQVSAIFVPTVIGIALITMIVWLLLGKPLSFSLARAIAVLVISCPCALGLATPVAIMVGNGVGAKNGILFKTAESLEVTGNGQIVALDKTGTITLGEPQVTDIYPIGISEEELLKLAYALEKKSEHPLAKAIVKKAEEKEISLLEIDDFEIFPGNGLKGRIEEDVIYAGNRTYIEKMTSIPEELSIHAKELAQEGKTPIYFVKGHEVIGLIAIADVMKEDAPRAIQELKNLGVEVVMLTGDNDVTAKAIGEKVGVDHVIANVLPNQKEAYIQKLQKQGEVIMVGDGINDAPALTRANIGIAIGAGTDVAIDAADVVLRKSALEDVPAAIRLSRATKRNIHQNLFWAFFYNLLCIPIAAGALTKFGFTLNPMWGAAAMSLSSFFVVSNALRLNLFQVYDSKNDKPLKNLIHLENIKEEQKMKKTLKIEGMMCEHCEMTVKKALESIDGVESAAPSHTNNEAIVELSKEVSDEVLKEAVEAKDYKVVEIA